MTDLRFPIGDFAFDGEMTPERRQIFIQEIEALPDLIRQAVSGLSTTQIDMPYRPAGWTIRQVIHHLPDSHMNSYIRMKLALTEENPTIRPYFEDRWGELVDGRDGPIEMSLALLDALHERWVLMLQGLSDDDLARTFVHPEMGKTLSIDTNIALYAWHGNHHLAHITSLRGRKGW
ncbi:MAG: putative metal-dependent hydrolase [Candidatus Latescibacteria bacterium]|nr:putative metal-dependent hydrolase [Candidatus Latescibacterota bacterium]